MFMCGFLHTALSLFLPKLNFRSIRETIQGGIILDWVDLPKEKENKYPRVLVVLLPGLTGGLKDKYI